MRTASKLKSLRLTKYHDMRRMLCLIKQHAMKTYWMSGGIALRILNPDSTWRWVVRYMPRPLYPQGMSTWYPLDRRLGGLQNQSGSGGEEKKFSAPTGNQNPVVQPVA